MLGIERAALRSREAILALRARSVLAQARLVWLRRPLERDDMLLTQVKQAMRLAIGRLVRWRSILARGAQPP